MQVRGRPGRTCSLLQPRRARAQRQYRATSRTDRSMDIIRQLAVLWLCAAARGEPLSEAVERRRDKFGVYAGEYSGGYEPVMLALPLHAPLPVVRVLSQAPLTHDARYAASVRHAAYADPPYTYDYDAEYSPAEYSPEYAAPAEPTILYARPTAQGGYTYRRPGKRAPHKKASPPREEAPVILRIHKYKLYKDW